MALGNIFLIASVIALYCAGCTKSEGWTTASPPVSSSQDTTFPTTTPSSSRISDSSSHRDVTSSSLYPSRRDLNSRAMQVNVTRAAAAGVTVNYRLQDATANSFYPSRRDWSKQASEDDDNPNVPVTTQEYPGRRDYYPSRRERPQQKVEKIQVRLHEIISSSWTLYG